MLGFQLQSSGCRALGVRDWKCGLSQDVSVIRDITVDADFFEITGLTVLFALL